MMEEDMLVIKVPASTANLGPGFDSIGLALNLYLTVEARISDKWLVEAVSNELKHFPQDESNYISQIAIRIASMYGKTMPPCHLRVGSDIPLARGLGSSAAAIVAGIELADSMCRLHLSKQEKLEIATKIEGHPDNVGASLFGGLVVGCKLEEEVYVSPFYNLDFEAIVVVPKEELLTKSAREILPQELPFRKAVEASAVANQLIASLLTKNWSQAGKMMNRDLFHQPYRRQLVPHLEEIECSALNAGAFGVALSGAGPTAICFVEQENREVLKKALLEQFNLMKILQVRIDNEGSRVEKIKSCSIH